MNVAMQSAGLKRAARLLAELKRRTEQARFEGSLIEFVKAAWPSIDSAPYQGSWAIDALAEHLQAVTEGQIRRLLVNFPPRAGKTSVASICFPAWTWARQEISFLSGPQVRFLCGSYNHDLALANSNMTRRLILSPWYQSLWGKKFTLRSDQNTKTKFDNTAEGTRLSTSVGGSLLGIGGDIVVIDDPHNVSTGGIESEAERRTALEWWREISTTRLNDPKRSPIVVIMQRLHEDDVAGHILSSEWSSDWTHLNLPMAYDWQRHCVTVLGWQDPRGLDDDGEPLVVRTSDGARVPRDAHAANVLEEERQGALMWPERFGPAEVEKMRAELGPYLASGRLDQMPAPKGGGIFKRSWWQLWEEKLFPPMSYVVASLDSAFTKKESNDPSALTVWGVFTDKESGQRRIMLVHAFRKFLEMHGDPTPRLVEETVQIGDSAQIVKWKYLQWRRRVSAKWGLVEWVADTCRWFHVHDLLIEAKASGLSVAQEMQRLHGREGWGIRLINPKGGDKYARALSVVPLFSQGLIYSPDRDWAEMVMTELANFPYGRRDDLVDSTSQGLSYLRTVGLAQTGSEQKAEETEGVIHRRRAAAAIYPV
jgi:predicted phage terminase large subunit-like protein